MLLYIFHRVLVLISAIKVFPILAARQIYYPNANILPNTYEALHGIDLGYLRDHLSPVTSTSPVEVGLLQVPSIKYCHKGSRKCSFCHCPRLLEVYPPSQDNNSVHFLELQKVLKAWLCSQALGVCKLPRVWLCPEFGCGPGSLECPLPWTSDFHVDSFPKQFKTELLLEEFGLCYHLS